LPYINALIGIARDIRADIPVAGEYLFEHTTREFRKLIPSAASAIIVLNVGMRRLNLSGVRTLIRQDTELPLIGMTVGPTVYWSRTTWNQKRKEVWNIKQQIETRFLKAGFAATLTLVGDGADGHFGIEAAVNTVDWQAILADDTTTQTQ
jgi:hypothetical protein